MKVLILGNGGREHALALKINESPQCDKLFVAPGNGGTASIAKNISLSGNQELLKFIEREEIKLVVVGPEKYLVDGTVDYLRENDILVFGPNREAANIEGDKLFAKKIMYDNNVPTAKYFEFSNTSSKEDIYNCLKKQKYPIVIKANGLAAGKGVTNL